MIKKAVLPVAGFGTRFLPASKATPKEMLPIIDKPLVQYAVEEAIDSGINEIIFITSPEKHSIKKHFKTNKDLELRLQNSNKQEMIEKLNPKKFSKVKFYYINQYEQNGLGHAVLQAESVIGNNSFAVMLPDDLFLSKKSCLDQLIDIFVEKKSSVIAVNKIDKNNIHKYGVIKPGEQNQGSIKIDDIVEKPVAEDAPSDMAVCGRYILNPAIFKHLKLTKSDKSGEIQLTDAIKLLLKTNPIFSYEFTGTRYDCGSKLGFIKANILYALKDDQTKNDLKEFIKNLL